MVIRSPVSVRISRSVVSRVTPWSWSCSRSWDHRRIISWLSSRGDFGGDGGFDLAKEVRRGGLALLHHGEGGDAHRLDLIEVQRRPFPRLGVFGGRWRGLGEGFDAELVGDEHVLHVQTDKRLDRVVHVVTRSGEVEVHALGKELPIVFFDDDAK